MKFIKNFVLFIIYLLMIIIACITVYFCLDVFSVIEVPKQYSLVSLLNSQIEVLAEGVSFEDVVNSEENVEKKIVRPIQRETTNTVIDVDFEEFLEQINSARPDPNTVDIPEVEIDLENINAKRFYYNQLDEVGKIIYDELYNNRENLKTGTYTVDYGRTFNDLLNTDGGTEILNNDFQYAINALTFDNPELFYLDITQMYLLTEKTTRAFSTTYNISIGANGGNYLSEEFNDVNSVNQALLNVINIEKDLVNREYSSKVEQIRTVHDYLIENIEYDGSKTSTAYNIYGALIEGKCVCEGYARSFKYIMDDMNIPTIIVCGIGQNRNNETESHAWNYVYLDGEWYAVDSTWDDPVIIGTGRIDESYKYSYFLKGSNEFFKDHFEDGNIVTDARFVYPKISETDY